MIEFLTMVPEEIGWAMVGFVGAFALIMFCKVVGLTIEMVVERARKERVKREKRERALPRRMGCQK